MKGKFPIWIDKKILKEEKEKEKVHNKKNADKKNTLFKQMQNLKVKIIKSSASVTLPRRKRFAFNKAIEKKFEKIFTQLS